MEPSSTQITTLLNATQTIADFAQKTMNYTIPVLTSGTSWYLPFLHDAFYMFGLALNKSLQMKTGLNDGLKYMEYIKCSNFIGTVCTVYLSLCHAINCQCTDHWFTGMPCLQFYHFLSTHGNYLYTYLSLRVYTHLSFQCNRKFIC